MGIMRDTHQTAANSSAGSATRILASYSARALARRTHGSAVGTSAKALLLALLTAMALVLSGTPAAAQGAPLAPDFSNPDIYPSGGVGTSSVTTADFDRDGFDDIATGNYNSTDVSVLMGDGQGGFSAPSNFSAGASPSSLTTADFDGNGLADIATANWRNADAASVSVVEHHQRPASGRG